MPRKTANPAPTETVDEIVAQAVAAKDGNERRRIAAKAGSLGSNSRSLYLDLHLNRLINDYKIKTKYPPKRSKTLND
jgi:hypothetical protein